MGRIPLVLLACGSFNPITNQHMRLFELARDHMHYTGGFQVVGGIVSPVSDNYGKRGLVPAHHRVAMAKLALHSSDWVTVDDWESRQPDWTETVVTLRHHLQKLLGQRASVTDLQTVHSSHLDGGKIPPGRGLWLSHTKFDSFTCKPTGINGISGEREVAKSQERSRVGQARIPTMIVFVCPPGSLEPLQLKLLCGADFLDTFRVPGLWREEHLEELVGHFGLVCVSRGDLQADRAVHESDTLFRHRHNIFLVREWVRNETSATEIRRALRRGLSVKYLLPDTVIEYIQKHELYTWQSEQRNKGAMLRPLRQQGAPSEQLNDSRLFEPET